MNIIQYSLEFWNKSRIVIIILSLLSVIPINSETNLKRHHDVGNKNLTSAKSKSYDVPLDLNKGEKATLFKKFGFNTKDNIGSNKRKARKPPDTLLDYHEEEEKESADFPKLLQMNGFVRNCISSDYIGRIESDTDIQDLKSDVQYSWETPDETAQLRQESFKKVYNTKAWGHSWDKDAQIGLSGQGATVSWTQEATVTLHMVINAVKEALRKPKLKLLDLPCGDMNWMSRFLITRDDIDYTGYDIVPDLISHHKKEYSSRPWKFKLVDVLAEPLDQSYDLILNRMMLQHLYYPDVLKLLERFSQSGSSYLLTTTFSRHNNNTELNLEDNPGRFRKLNLELPPVALTPPLCLQRDGPGDGSRDGWEHFMGLWQLPLKQIKHCPKPYAVRLKNTAKTLYSCSNWVMV